MRRFPIAALLLLAVASGVCGQVRSSQDDRERARLIGVLEQTALSVELDAVPARVAFKSLSAALSTTILVHYAVHAGDPGIDPEAPVSLYVVDSPARLILEATIEQCTTFEPCTWQLRHGYIEVGTKQRLGRRSAAETRQYPVGDLTLEPPYFNNSPPRAGAAPAAHPPAFGAGEDFDKHPYSCSALTRPAIEVDGVARKAPGELADELAEAIVELIEPGNWDYGQADEDDVYDRGLAVRARVDGPWQAASTNSRKIARIRIFRDTIIVVAPDYIHRQISGYPRAIPPPPLSVEERRERSAKASVDGAKVVVQPTGGAAAERRR